MQTNDITHNPQVQGQQTCYETGPYNVINLQVVDWSYVKKWKYITTYLYNILQTLCILYRLKHLQCM